MHQRTSTPRFTFLGLILLLSGVTVLSVVGVPWWFGRADVTLEAAAQLLADDLQDVQNRAALRNERLEVRFDISGGGYDAVTAKGRALRSPVGPGAFTRRYDIDAVFRGVQVRRTSFQGSNAVAFGRMGECLWSAQIELAFKDEVRVISIADGSGGVKISSSN
jgi:hypothetical protein